MRMGMEMGMGMRMEMVMEMAMVMVMEMGMRGWWYGGMVLLCETVTVWQWCWFSLV